MSGRLLILGAGSGPGNNLIRSLKAGDPALFIVGCNDDRFNLRKSEADRNCPLPTSQRAWPRVLRQTIEDQRIDLVIPNSELDVTRLSDLRRRLPCRVFLPRKNVIELCKDQYDCNAYLRRRGFPVPATYPIKTLAAIDGLFRRFGKPRQLWCRVRTGTGPVGAIPVKDPAQVRAWIRYWDEMRRVPGGSFTLSEYLPGRDLSVQCLMKDGKLIRGKMHERLECHVVGGVLSGVSSSAALARMVCEPEVMRMSANAIRAIDPRASGIFFLDLKGDSRGTACITEINAGRFSNVAVIHDLAAADSTSVAYVRVALGETVEPREPSGYPEDLYVLRGTDTVPAIVRGRELFDPAEFGLSAALESSTEST